MAVQFSTLRFSFTKPLGPLGSAQGHPVSDAAKLITYHFTVARVDPQLPVVARAVLTTRCPRHPPHHNPSQHAIANANSAIANANPPRTPRTRPPPRTRPSTGITARRPLTALKLAQMPVTPAPGYAGWAAVAAALALVLLEINADSRLYDDEGADEDSGDVGQKLVDVRRELEVLRASLCWGWARLEEGLRLQEPRIVARRSYSYRTTASRTGTYANLLLSGEGVLKLTDFSNAVQVQSESPRCVDLVGVPYWKGWSGSHNALKADLCFEPAEGPWGRWRRLSSCSGARVDGRDREAALAVHGHRGAAGTSSTMMRPSSTNAAPLRTSSSPLPRCPTLKLQHPA
ncbi:hypothetical protein C8J57DRAFT_1716196 [Mycena rebaudengoi]|nr:hypothetical protein C8J57DRAFT_1716196 [Mycena rebaudengoi]